MPRPSRIPPPTDRIVYTVDEARSVLRVRRATIYALMRQGRIKYFYLQSSRRIPASQIHALVKEAS